MNFQPRDIDQFTRTGSYASEVEAAAALLKTQPTWNGVTAEAIARMRLQNRFKTGLD
ncbi:MAG: isocitrate lyase, partial [Tardiphaga sp.]